MKNSELYHWIALKMVRGIGNVLFLRLLERFSSPAKVFENSAEELRKVEGISSKICENILAFDRWNEVSQMLEVLERSDITVLSLHSSEYPQTLKTIYDPPPLFFIYGTICEDDWISLAVVGSRRPTRYGLVNAERVSRKLAKRGLTIVSGLARGIDAAAHKGALSGGGRTIAVLGSGLFHIYPKEHKKLARQITETGAVISEFLPDTPPDAANFPMRNRVISGMSLGTLVVEAAKRSGSLITARLASEQGREVFAIPGEINTMQSKGTNGLIKKGAKLVEDIHDIIEELQHMLPAGFEQEQDEEQKSTPVCKKNLSTGELLVYNAIPSTGMHVDEVIAATGLTADKVASLLLVLELNDFIRKEAGFFFKVNF